MNDTPFQQVNLNDRVESDVSYVVTANTPNFYAVRDTHRSPFIIIDDVLNPLTNFQSPRVSANGRHFNISLLLPYNPLAWNDIPNVYNRSRDNFPNVYNRSHDHFNVSCAKSNLKKYKIGKCKEECGLCGETVDSKMYRLSCGHTFHVRCEVSLSKWVDKCHTEGRDPTCPMCRSLIE